MAELKEELGRRYAGDKVVVVALVANQADLRRSRTRREDRPLSAAAVGRAADADRGGGRRRRAIRLSAESPARVGIAAGDALVSLAGHKIGTREEAMARLAGLEADEEAEAAFRRGDKVQTAKIKFDRLPEALPPGELPPAHPPLKPGLDDSDERGVVPCAGPRVSQPRLGVRARRLLRGGAATAWSFGSAATPPSAPRTCWPAGSRCATATT